MRTFSELSKEALRYVNEKYLSKPMTDAENVRDHYITANGNHIDYRKGQQVAPEAGHVYRVNHGNAHNVRVTAKVGDVIAFYANPATNNNPLSRQLFSGFLRDNALEKLEIVASFYVACRESEIGWSDSKKHHEAYRKNSADAFAEYAKTIQKNGEPLFSDREIAFYRQILIDPYFQSTYVRTLDATVKCILSTSHGLDLARCFEPEKLSGMGIFLPSSKEDEETTKHKKLFFQKSEIQLILTGNEVVSTFDMNTGTYQDNDIQEKTALFIQASLDADIAMRLVALSDHVKSTKIAHKIAKDLNNVAQISKAEFLSKLDRIERAHTSRDADTKEEQHYFHYDDDEKYLLTQGPLPKSIYTA